jgi:hypothetical protein
VSRVEAVQVGGEAAHHRQSERPPATAAARGQCRPRERLLDGDGLGADLLEVVDELGEQLSGALELVAERATDPQVVGERVAKRAHAASPIQERAIVRSASRSTFA